MPGWLVIIFMAVVGACIGSFLNVVIFRMPRGLSIVSPGSRCPKCEQDIAWYDNIPVLSYLFLRGRCRHCAAPISPRYALIESVTAILFVGLYDAFYQFGTSPYASHPWPQSLLIGHLALLAVLVACSAIDIEYYLIDIRISYVGMLTGIAMWVLTPELRGMAPESQPPVGLTGGIFGAVVGIIVRHWLLLRGQVIPDEPEPEEAEEPIVEAEEARVGWIWIAGLIVYLLGAAGLILWTLLDGGNDRFRGFLYVLWPFIAILAAAIPIRQSDQEIVEAIEQERVTARRTALNELAGLLPVISGFLLGFAVFTYLPWARDFGGRACFWTVGPLCPVLGLAWGLGGLVGAAAFGWAVRIFFTLLFGKEAMGAGDIYILAAIGSVTGTAVAVVGFFLGSVIGVFGIGLLMLWKTSRALSYGPWIAIGTWVVLLFQEPVMNYLKPLAAMVRQIIQGD